MREFHTTVSTGRSPRSLIARRRSGIESQDPSQLTGSLRVIARIARVNGPGAKLPYGDRSTAVIVGCGLKVVGLWVGGRRLVPTSLAYSGQSATRARVSCRSACFSKGRE